MDGGNVVAELEDDELSASYLRGANLISRTTTATEYYTFNAHGDVVNLTNASGISVKTYDYDAFGNEKDRVGSDPNPFRYCGEYFDVESGAYYLRARYYDPSIGRFTQEDPACAGLNWYTYCNNSPIRFIDPTGFVPMCADEDIIKEPTPAPKPTTAERKRAHDEQKAHAIYEEQMAELTLAETEDMKMSEAGKQMLKDFELSEGYAPYLFTEEGIYPYWVGDGGITIGYGHYISETDVINDPSEKALYDTYTPGARIDVILYNERPRIVINSIVVPFDVVEAIFGADVLLAERAINKWAKDNGIILSQEQFDALIMMRHIKGTLGNICDLIERGAPRSEWEKADLRIGASDRRTKQLDLYFNGIYY